MMGTSNGSKKKEKAPHLSGKSEEGFDKGGSSLRKDLIKGDSSKKDSMKGRGHFEEAFDGCVQFEEEFDE